MKPHKHAEILKAIAENSEVKIQWLIDSGEWVDVKTADFFICIGCDIDYRIKPEPKPDVKIGYKFEMDGSICVTQGQCYPNLYIIWDGETGALKNAEVLK